MSLSCGCIQIYTGDGKGKTTAAFGLAVRAAGHGLRVGIIQFMKPGRDSGEVDFLQQTDLISVHSFGADHFVSEGQASAEDKNLATQAMKKAYELLGQDIDVLILDEVINAVYYELIAEESLLDLFRQKPQKVELVVTGRHATKRMVEAADLVTQMKEIKHPYHKGIAAREGIDF